MSPFSRRKGDVNMRGARSTPVVSSLTVMTFCLLSAAIAGAQTPVAAVNKPVAELSPSVSKPAAIAAAPAIAPAPVAAPANEETVKPATETPKAETGLVKPETPPTAPAPAAAPAAPAPVQQCTRTIKADVVAIPKALMLNRLGATIPNALVFALRGDTIGSGNNIQLRPGKRPRPIALRANVGDCLQIKFTNAVPPAAFNASTPNSPAVTTQEVSLHIQGQEWNTGSGDDGSFVGKNSSSLASPVPAPTPPPMPPNQQTYNLFVKNEGTFLLYTMG